MALYTSQVGDSQVGYDQVGIGGTSGLPIPPLNSATIPWALATNPTPAPPPQWRRRTLDSFAQGIIQPLLAPGTIPWALATNPTPAPPPQWRRRTLDSAILWPVPSGFTQQINLYLQGFSHRGIGVPTIVGGVQRIAVFMGGVDVTSYAMFQTATFTLQVNTTGTCQYKMRVPAADSFRPIVGMSILLQEFGVTKFSGYVDHFDKTVYPGATPALIWFDVNGVDRAAPTQRRIVAKSFTSDTLYNIANFFCTVSMAGDGIVASGVDPTIIVGDPFNFQYIKVQDALNQLAAATNTIWWVDKNGVLWMQLVSNLALSSFQIHDGGSQQIQAAEPGMSDALTETDSIANYRNKQYVRTSSQILSLSVSLTASHTFTGAPADFVCITLYPLTAQPDSVKENGVELVGTDRLFELKVAGGTVYPPYPPGGYYWSVGFYGVWAWPTGPGQQPTAGTTLVVKYTGASTYQSNVVVYADPTEIARMAAITGTSGIFEELEDYNGTISYDAALALAQGIEALTAPPPKQLVATTLQPIEGVGYLVSINLALYGIVGNYVIRQVVSTSIANWDMGKGTSFQSQVTLVEQRTQGDWKNWFERLLARLAANQIPQPSENPTWALAFDQPGSVSPDLQTGTFGSPYAIQTGLGTIEYVSAVFATQPASPIVIDILLNNKSIFDEAKLKYGPGNWPNQVLYGNFALTPTTVKRGDQLTLQVVSVDAIQPGKNGTVTVVITAQ